MNDFRILIAEPEHFSDKAIKQLSEIGSVACRRIRQDEVSRSMTEYDVIWVRLHIRIRSHDIPTQRRCRFVVSATTGTDHLDLGALERAEIRVFCLRGEEAFLETIGVTAELTLALILALARRIPSAVNAVVQKGRWERDAIKGVELFGKTAGIVGMGRLGRKMNTFLSSLGMQIIAWDPYVSKHPGVRMASSLNELLRKSHVVTIHVPLNGETRRMFDACRFGAMRTGAFFVNTSRGDLVDETALLDVLTSGHLGGAALDVLCGEPDIDMKRPLVRYARYHDNVIITPHIGGAVEDVMKRCEDYMANLLCRKIRK